MRPIPIAAIVVLAAAFSTTVATGAPATRAATCGSGFGPTKYSTTQAIEGKTLIVNCGPATAKVRYKGKTYAFKNGTCFRYLGAFKLNLGESLVVPGPHKGPYSSMTINTGPGGHVEIGMGVGKISIYAAVKSSGVGVKGRFSSITAGVPFTGSWNCGGPIRKS